MPQDVRVFAFVARLHSRAHQLVRAHTRADRTSGLRVQARAERNSTYSHALLVQVDDQQEHVRAREQGLPVRGTRTHRELARQVSNRNLAILPIMFLYFKQLFSSSISFLRFF